MIKELPKGSTWLWVDLFASGSDEEFTVWLAEMGIHVPPEHVSIKEFGPRGDGRGNCAGARVAIDAATLVPILNWIIDGRTFRGEKVEFKPIHAKVNKPQ